MSFNGSGTFNINSTGQPVVANTLIEAAVFNAFTADAATGLSTCITKDGQTTVTANIPMAGNRFTGLGAGVAAADSVRVAEIQSQLYTAFTTAGTSTAYTLAPAPAITAYVAGQSFDVTFHTASGAAPTLQINSIATTPNLVKQIGAGTYANIALNDIPANHRSRCTLLSATQVLVEKVTLSAAGAAASGANGDITSLTALTSPISLIALRSYLAGCTMSTAGGSTTMSIAEGAAMNSTNAYLMQLAATSKTTASWALGTAAGGLDTGAIAASTWYHFYVIRRPDTGVVDVTFSTNATTPTLPANYTQYRRIGSGLTDGASQWVRFVQVGDWFDWYTPVKDVEASAPGTTAVTRTLSVPTGVLVIARINAGVNNSGIAVAPGLYLSALDTDDVIPSLSNAPLWASGSEAFDAAGGARRSYTQMSVRTNTSAQIRSRVSASDGNVTIRIATIGWIDRRGQDS